MARAVLAAVALAAVWAAWPAQLGGRSVFLSTVGTSMEPRISQGDLAIVRTGGPYRVGDVVAYRNDDLRQVALHRIVDARDDRYVLKGDNNDWIDSYEPVAEEIVGRLWVHVPKGGTWLDWLRRPRDAALLTVLVGLLVGTGARQVRRRMRRRQRRAGEPAHGAGRARRPAPRDMRTPAGARAVWLRVAAGSAAVALAGAAALAFATSRPALRTETVDVAYTHRGEFSYEAAATVPTDVLPGRLMRDGSPVYLRLAERLDLRFAYELDAEAVSRVRGSRRLSAVLTDTRGWERELPLGRAATFEGTAFEVAGTLDLVALQQLIQRFQDQTGATGTGFQLHVTADAEVEATIAEQQVRDSFAPRLVFGVDATALSPQPGEEGELLARSQAGAVQRDVAVPNRLRALGGSVPVTTAADAGRAVLTAGTLLLVVALLALWRAPAEHPSERIARRYGSRILTVERVEPRPDERVVRMGDIRDLVRIADGLEAPILRLSEGSVHRYLVQEGATTYVVEVDDAGGRQADPTVGRLPARLGTPLAPPGAPAPPRSPAGARDQLRLPPPVLEIDLSQPLPPPLAPPREAGGLRLPPAPPRRGR